LAYFIITTFAGQIPASKAKQSAKIIEAEIVKNIRLNRLLRDFTGKVHEPAESMAETE
jgi:hypothetical protein